MTATESTATTPGHSREESRAAVAAQNWKFLRYYNLYRLAAALVAVTIGLFLEKLPPFGSASQDLYRIASLIYLATGLVGLYTIRRRNPVYDSQVTVYVFADMTLLTMIMHSSGGLASGVGLLLLVAVAGSAVMLGSQRMTVFYAALATIAALLEHSWNALTGGDLALGVSGNYPQVGMFGIGLFATAFLGNTLAARLRATEALAERRGADLASMEQINDLIIQRMQAGVIVCDMAGTIRLLNEQAQKFLGIRAAEEKKSTLNDVAADLAIQLFQWLGNNPAQRVRKAFVSRAGYTLLPRFVTLGDAKDSVILIFLEDLGVLKQQAQQLKMEALARLTASIAHEIRNPLGALTNAAQLLGETTGAEDDGKRLIKIIDEQSKRMNIIVENVTQLSRRDRVHPVRLALKTWLDEFIQHYSETSKVPVEAFTQYGVQGIEICADPDQMFQVIGNLCQNALRASPPFTGTALIKFQAGKGAGPEERPCLDVIDWGKGVAPETVDHIFAPFFTTTPKGTGLGLYIARELCEGNGASLNYHPGDGGVGSRFRVTFARPEECAELGSL